MIITTSSIAAIVSAMLMCHMSMLEVVNVTEILNKFQCEKFKCFKQFYQGIYIVFCQFQHFFQLFFSFHISTYHSKPVMWYAMILNCGNMDLYLIYGPRGVVVSECLVLYCHALVPKGMVCLLMIYMKEVMYLCGEVLLALSCDTFSHQWYIGKVIVLQPHRLAKLGYCILQILVCTHLMTLVSPGDISYKDKKKYCVMYWQVCVLQA